MGDREIRCAREKQKTHRDENDGEVMQERLENDCREEKRNKSASLVQVRLQAATHHGRLKRP